jgi:hypothetical protein
MIGAGLFRSSSEKLVDRLADLEAQVASLTKRAEEGRVAEAEAQDKLVQDLAEGLDVADWRKKREAAEKKAAEAERDLKAAQDAAELVRGKLEQAQAAELLADLQKRYAAVQKDAPGALEDALVTGRAFSEAYGRLEGLRSEETSVIWQLRQAGDRETQVCGVPLVESALSDALGHAEGRQSQRILIPFWPRTTP